MNKRVKKAVDEFVEEVKKFDVDEIILYGSAARGEYVPEKSDVDILVVSREPKKTYEKILDIESDIGLRDNVLLSAVVKSPHNFKQELKWGSPFLRNVVGEGIVLYGKNNTKTAGTSG
ncbi:MAG: hypothetical protein MSIBF_00995 [Candidatus Altiarchaeales archaeon IMC4]|nr:MAG: hypothetical protein MSIBF_00995 [Candidatus Altiarchaeales archaeon IMC4]